MASTESKRVGNNSSTTYGRYTYTIIMHTYTCPFAFRIPTRLLYNLASFKYFVEAGASRYTLSLKQNKKTNKNGRSFITNTLGRTSENSCTPCFSTSTFFSRLFDLPSPAFLLPLFRANFLRLHKLPFDFQALRLHRRPVLFNLPLLCLFSFLFLTLSYIWIHTPRKLLLSHN
jgi:hypothetical protein